MVFIPLMAPVVLLAALGPLVRWKRDHLGALVKRMRAALGVSIVLGTALMLMASAPVSMGAAIALAGALWVLSGVLHSLWDQLRNRRSKWQALLRLPRSYVGMTLAHLGIGVFVVGVAAVVVYGEERDVRLAPGETVTLAGYRFELLGVDAHPGPNYQAERGKVRVSRNGKPVVVLAPEKRNYPVQGQPMTEAAIDPGLTRDLYVSLGERLGDGAWSVRVYVKPFVRWIWLGALMMALGGVLAASDRRYRAEARSHARAAAGGTLAGAGSMSR